MIIQERHIAIKTKLDIRRLMEFLDTIINIDIPDNFEEYLRERYSLWFNTGYTLYVVIEKKEKYKLKTIVKNEKTNIYTVNNIQWL